MLSVRLSPVAALCASAAALLVGCDRVGNGGAEVQPPAPTARTEPAIDGGEISPQPARLDQCRFASLSPAMTQAFVDLGLGAQIVGRTPFCDSVSGEVPIVGSLLDVDYERLLASRPTHLVVQPAAGGTDPELERLAAVHRWVLIERQLDRLEDVEGFVAELPTAMAPAATLEATAEFAAFRERCGKLAAEVHALRTPTDSPTPSLTPSPTPLVTLVLVGTEPLTAAGADTFVSEMLQAAGGVNAMKAGGYPELSFEDLVTLNPQAILVLRETPTDEAELARLLRPLLATSTDAVRSGRVVVHVDPLCMLPSTSAPRVVSHLAKTLASIAGRKAEAQ